MACCHTRDIFHPPTCLLAYSFHPMPVYTAFFCAFRAQSCYGVLHCSLDGSNSLELEDTSCEKELTMPPLHHSYKEYYKEYDAIVVSHPPTLMARFCFWTAAMCLQPYLDIAS